MRLIVNVIWVVVSGFELALAYALAGILAAVLVVTAPLAVPAFRLAGYALWPFGRVVVEKPGAGAGSAAANVVWFVLIGWWLVLAHVVVALLLFVTIIGIPFGVAVLKMSRLALAPYGKDVVDADLARRRDVRVVLSEPTHPRPA